MGRKAVVRGKVKKVVPAVRAAADAVAPEKKAALEAAADAAEQALGPKADGVAWAKAADPGIAALRKALAAADADLSEKQDQVLSELEDLARTLAGDEAAQAKARSWVVDNMPVFVFLEEYPELRGHQNIKDYLARLDKKVGADEDDRIADESFSKLCKVADLDPKQLQELYGQDESETRNQLVNRASAVVTGEIKRHRRGDAGIAERQVKKRYRPGVTDLGIDDLPVSQQSKLPLETPMSLQNIVCGANFLHRKEVRKLSGIHRAAHQRRPRLPRCMYVRPGDT